MPDEVDRRDAELVRKKARKPPRFLPFWFTSPFELTDRPAGGTAPPAVHGSGSGALAFWTGAVKTLKPAARRAAAGPLALPHVGPSLPAQEGSATVKGLVVAKPETSTTARLEGVWAMAVGARPSSARPQANARSPVFMAHRIRSLMKIEGSRVLLTGGSGGIGEAIASALSSAAPTCSRAGAGLGARARGRAARCDLSDRDAVAALPERAGRVDILVANVALPAWACSSEFTPEQMDRALDVNLRAPMILAQALAPAMVERGEGHLVFVSSLSGKTAAVGTSIYSATKYGMRGFASGLRDDLRGSGVGVTTVFPGFIAEAGMFADAGVELRKGVGTRKPEDVAKGVVRGIEHDRHEVDVAPLSLRMGAKLAGAFPEGMQRVQNRLGARDLAGQMAKGQESKR